MNTRDLAMAEEEGRGGYDGVAAVSLNVFDYNNISHELFLMIYISLFNDIY